MALRVCLLRLAVLTLLLARGVGALELGSEDRLLSVEIHGFASQGFIFSTDNNYLAYSKNGSFEFSEAGINFSKQLTDELRLGMQLFARKLGPTGTFSAKIDWFDLDYHPRDWFGLRAGRLKIPFGLYNDTSDIDSARVPVLLPQSVYPTLSRDYLLAQTGVELYGFLNLNGAGALDYNFYGGTIFADNTATPGSVVTVVSLEVPYLAGGRVLWETPAQGLRVGVSGQLLRVDYNLLYNLPAPTPVSARLPVVLWVGSAEYVHDDLLLAAEYSRWYARITNSSNEAVVPDVATETSERGYFMASYRVRRWLTPGVYYSVLFPNVAQRSGRQNGQQDVAATVRFDINSFWLVKLEGHYMIGTAGLTASLNDNIPISQLAPNWWAFFVKTTAHF